MENISRELLDSVVEELVAKYGHAVFSDIREEVSKRLGREYSAEELREKLGEISEVKLSPKLSPK